MFMALLPEFVSPPPELAYAKVRTRRLGFIPLHTEKAPKGNSESPWGLHIRSSWKIHFINPPEVQDQVVS
jgi:hypothetical protein